MTEVFNTESVVLTLTPLSEALCLALMYRLLPWTSMFTKHRAWQGLILSEYLFMSLQERPSFESSHFPCRQPC